MCVCAGRGGGAPVSYSNIYFHLRSFKETESEEAFRRMVEYLIVHGVPVDTTDKSQKPPEDYVGERMKEIYRSILEK